MKIAHILITVISLACIGCNSFQEKKDNMLPLNGMIYDLDNSPVSEVHVLVNGKSATTSDINGHFTLSKINLGKNYEFTFQKANCETISLNLMRNDPSQIIYVSMATSEQLLNEAEKDIKQSNWKAAEDFFNRAEKAGANPTDLSYLKSIYCYSKKDYDAAYKILDSLIVSGVDEPYVFLLAADILQYRLNDATTAAGYLNKYLEKKYDPDIESRRKSINVNK